MTSLVYRQQRLWFVPLQHLALLSANKQTLQKLHSAVEKGEDITHVDPMVKISFYRLALFEDKPLID